MNATYCRYCTVEFTDTNPPAIIRDTSGDEQYALCVKHEDLAGTYSDDVDFTDDEAAAERLKTDRYNAKLKAKSDARDKQVAADIRGDEARQAREAREFEEQQAAFRAEVERARAEREADDAKMNLGEDDE